MILTRFVYQDNNHWWTQA